MSAAVAIIGYPCRHVSQVPLSASILLPRNNPFAANHLHDNLSPLIALSLYRSTESKPNR